VSDTPTPATATAAIPRPRPWYATLRAEPPSVIGKLLGLACVALLFGVWWFVTRGPVVERIVGPAKMPSPGEVWAALDRLPDGILGRQRDHRSLWRVLKGFALATVVGVGLGVLAGSFRGVAAFFQPLVIFGAACR
jgi:NitT/TauT family transport system permease protein